MLPQPASRRRNSEPTPTFFMTIVMGSPFETRLARCLEYARCVGVGQLVPYVNLFAFGRTCTNQAAIFMTHANPESALAPCPDVESALERDAPKNPSRPDAAKSTDLGFVGARL